MFVVVFFFSSGLTVEVIESNVIFFSLVFHVKVSAWSEKERERECTLVMNSKRACIAG